MKPFLTFILLISFALNLQAKGMPKEYLKIKDTQQSKEYFFNYVYQLVTKENLRILEERAFIQNLLSTSVSKLDSDSKELEKLSKLMKKYRVKKLYDFKSYLKKIDVVPPSMALAQAAVESGWGKSRFTKKANNIFGHWTYNSKIGMIPQRRAKGSKHFIRIFKTLQDSMDAYMLNLNRNKAYATFHKKRFELRSKNLDPNGLILSQTMLKYSGIGKKYLKILRIVINKNKLKKYDDKFYQSIK